MSPRSLFLGAYACSGLAGLIYEVSWARLVTLYIGHSTAAASTVVAAFMGGLAGGSFLGGHFAPHLTPRQALYAYALIESAVVLIALVVRWELAALTPLLTWAYRDGAPGILFPTVRLVACLFVMLIPALALGATFPLAVRWFARDSAHPGRIGGGLYAANTTGAAVGALAAGFALIPVIGISGTTAVGMTASGLAVAGALLVAYRSRAQHQLKVTTQETAAAVPLSPGTGERAAGSLEPMPSAKARSIRPWGWGPTGTEKGRLRGRERRARHKPRRAGSSSGEPVQVPERPWLAATVLGLTGFATLTYEIAWTRVFSLIIGPTTYAFAATLAAVISGLAAGSLFGSWLAGRTRRPALWLALALAGTAMATIWTSWLAGGPLPGLVAADVAQSSDGSSQLLAQHATLVASVILPTAMGLGVAFPLALELVGRDSMPRRLGLVYAINTIAAVAGSLVTGFVTIPLFGLQHTLSLVGALLGVAAFIAIVGGMLSVHARIAGLLPTTVAVVMLMWSPPWDRALLASGAYKYAARVPKELDLESALKAGRLLYYRDGAASTVSVKELTGSISLAIDGKVDASTTTDMLTQKLLAHLPLVLHPNARDVYIIGLGSGVTLASALLHPVARVDVAEISPEVVEASRYFAAENRNPLDDPRTKLIVGDGRSHLLLSHRQYDVIISEPSNPWMAGVAALFTREFFRAARGHLAPGGIICQWAHTYDISQDDLRSIVATFASVFPDGTLWLIGDGDLLLIASTEPLDAHLANLDKGWEKPAIAADLNAVSALDPFALFSLFVGGPEELRRYAAGAALQTDDHLALEFSGPHALNRQGAAADNSSELRHLLDAQAASAAASGSLAEGPPSIRRRAAAAGAAEWRNRGAMMLKAQAYEPAYQDYVKALTLDPTDAVALDGVVRTAVATQREAETLRLLKSSAVTSPQTPAIWIATSKLLAAGGAFDEALAAAREASNIKPVHPAALEQLASILADRGDGARLDQVVNELQQIQPKRAASSYYAAASRFIRGEFAEALRLARQALAADPTYAAAHNLLGATYASLGQRDAAREAFQASLRLDPRDPATYTNLGLLELEAANRVAAAGYFAEALSLDPRSLAARQGLAQSGR